MSSSSSLRGYASLLICAATLATLPGCGDPGITRPGPRSEIFVELTDVVHGAGRFVAVGASQGIEDGYLVIDSERAVIVLSEDATTWRRVALPSLEGALFDVAYGNGSFVAVGGRNSPTGTRSLLLRSADGEEWTAVAGAPPLAWRSIVFGNGRFLAAGIDPATQLHVIAESFDGISWEEIAETNLFSTRLVFGAGTFILYGEAGGVGVSEDGENWSWIPVPPLNLVSSLSYVDGRFVASGVFDCCYGEVPAGIAYFKSVSLDGRSWETSQRRAGPSFWRLAFGNGSFIALTSGAIYRSEDLGSWSRTYDTEEGTRWRTGVTFAEGRFVVVGRHEITTSEDGRGWRATTIPD